MQYRYLHNKEREESMGLMDRDYMKDTGRDRPFSPPGASNTSTTLRVNPKAHKCKTGSGVSAKWHVIGSSGFVASDVPYSAVFQA